MIGSKVLGTAKNWLLASLAVLASILVAVAGVLWGRGKAKDADLAQGEADLLNDVTDAQNNARRKGDEGIEAAKDYVVKPDRRDIT